MSESPVRRMILLTVLRSAMQALRILGKVGGSKINFLPVDRILHFVLERRGIIVIYPKEFPLGEGAGIFYLLYDVEYIFCVGIPALPSSEDFGEVSSVYQNGVCFVHSCRKWQGEQACACSPCVRLEVGPVPSVQDWIPDYIATEGLGSIVYPPPPPVPRLYLFVNFVKCKQKQKKEICCKTT